MRISLFLTFLFLTGCRRDAAEELERWMKSACGCNSIRCAETRKSDFWHLVGEFRDEAPSPRESRRLRNYVDAGQQCIATFGVDLYQRGTSEPQLASPPALPSIR